MKMRPRIYYTVVSRRWQSGSESLLFVFEHCLSSPGMPPVSELNPGDRGPVLGALKVQTLVGALKGQTLVI